jgi:HAE1 family hydrophobic/amphiphilic exporter-1
MGGIVGRFMSSFGLTSSFAIGVSLLVSFTLTPMLAARLIKRAAPAEGPAAGAVPSEGDAPAGLADESKVTAGEPGSERATAYESAEREATDAPPWDEVARPEPVAGRELRAKHSSKESRWYKPIDRTYTWMLRWSMAHRWAIVLMCLGVMLSIVPLFMLVGKNFLPVDDQSQFEINFRSPEGSTLAATSSLAERIAADIRQNLPGVTDTLVTIGGGQEQLVNNASIYVKLADIGDREKSQVELMEDTRPLLAKYPKELRTNIGQVQAISGGGFRNADVQYVIGGPDLQKLTEYSEKLTQKLATVPNVVDVDSSLIVGKPEVRVEIDRARAADLGVRVGDIAQALNVLVAGQEVTTYNEGTDQYDVRVRAVGQARTSPEALANLFVQSSKGGLTSLSNLVRVEEGTGPSAIDRLNRQRQVTVTANVTSGGSQSEVIARLDQFVKEIGVGPEYTTGLAGRSKELGRAGFYFMFAFLLSFIFMYMVLAAQFESFIHPVTILLTLPLAMPFGILSLLITGQTVNIFSGLGLLLLFGVVKKNAILQIDHTNELRAQGMERLDAIIQANRDRLRPILMTTVALVAGMLPLTLSTGPGAGTNRSIGVLVVGGQSLCLLLTLLAVPVFYSLFDDVGRSRVFSRAWSRAAGPLRRLRRRGAAAAQALFGAFGKH